MANKLKIKLLKEQVDNICSEITFASTSALGLTYKKPRELVIEVSEDQIVREKTNVEKWEGFMKSIYLSTSSSVWPEIAKILDQLGYNADTAYKEVCGEL